MFSEYFALASQKLKFVGIKYSYLFTWILYCGRQILWGKSIMTRVLTTVTNKVAYDNNLMKYQTI